MIAVMLRRGFPRELIDYLGNETTGQTFAPEKLVPHTTAGIWLMGETARKFGYDIPLAGCFEFTSRAERDLGAAAARGVVCTRYAHRSRVPFPDHLTSRDRRCRELLL